MRSDEFPAVVDAIRDQLKSRGFVAEADRLRMLVHEMAWPTSTEIYGELSLSLNEIRNERRDLPSDIASEIDRVTKSIDRICGGR